MHQKNTQKSIKIPIHNYLPDHFKNLLAKEITENNFKSFNFFYLFNIPEITEKDGKISIKINENIDKFYWDKNFINSLNNRIKHSLNNMNVKNFEATLSWRMIIGLGGTHPQETSMTLHHIYGIPYIPGSAVKGVTRHWIIQKEFNGKEPTEKEFKNHKCKKDFDNIFGTNEQQGEIIFFDAYPVEEIKLKIDIMNPHYPDYYEGKAAPADWQDPRPIKFLTVEKTKFRFYLAAKKDQSALLNKAYDWLKEALTKYGIGAKTSVGYGYFD